MEPEIRTPWGVIVEIGQIWENADPRFQNPPIRKRIGAFSGPEYVWVENMATEHKTRIAVRRLGGRHYRLLSSGAVIAP